MSKFSTDFGKKKSWSKYPLDIATNPVNINIDYVNNGVGY